MTMCVPSDPAFLTTQQLQLCTVYTLPCGLEGIASHHYINLSVVFPAMASLSTHKDKLGPGDSKVF